ncbi:glycosyl transferase family 2 [Pseudopedobacter saltans DSM 12145]|uniref:Glycosyl transferase family 2 n=1 Tax=Pseudopedobacter saltans (strain ATCC 51119 / DSM 12145 / JCM 21818 / CCUG 39354 / LMG 10337 / NBRC 100064 / NCIMB 13643) TaxID=762903 RepID=F0S9N2_PSESL|nr:glycosyltransferase family 2 protein [Pseudopedobacter saltans]ADY51388.1 glycosyl transferase family 2 [Pseudopedobacter saltans DSM 12145]
MENEDIMVSICCITYNQEKYIGHAIESFLMQKTNFKYEVIIGDDCSTDRTCEIMESYCQMHPNKIKLLKNVQNLGGTKNQVKVIREAKGKYIAICDGDDYWTDPLKLQKQVDFMEANPDCVICCHYTKVIDEEGKLVYEHPEPKMLIHYYEDLLIGNRKETRTSSLLVRNTKEVTDIDTYNWYYKAYGADVMFKLFILSKTEQKIYVLPEVMGVYRLHRGGMWSLLDSKIKQDRSISDFNIIIAHFPYSRLYKKKLLTYYLNKYFLFELKTLNLSRAFHTIYRLTFTFCGVSYI